jgi:hypothetical protein
MNVYSFNTAKTQPEYHKITDNEKKSIFTLSTGKYGLDK